MNNEEMLRAMGVKSKTPQETEEKVKTDISPLGMDDIEIPVPRRENPSTVLDAPKPIKEKDTTFSHRDPNKEPTTNELLVSLITQQRRTNSLLEQMRNISLGIPITESTEEVSSNGER